MAPFVIFGIATDGARRCHPCMHKSVAVGLALATGLMLGRISSTPIVQARDTGEATTALRQANREISALRVALAQSEHRLVAVWDRIDAALAHYARATSVMDRESARHRLERIRWDMDAVAARIDVERAPVRIKHHGKWASFE